MQSDEIIEILSGCPQFMHWPHEDLSALVVSCQVRTVHHGEALWTEGQEGDSAFILLKGRVERSQHVRPEGHRFWQFEQPGSMLSLASLVERWPHTSAGAPLEPSVVLELKRDKFLQMFNAGYPAAYRIMDAIAEHIVQEMRDANRRVHQVFGHPAETLRLLRRRVRDHEREGDGDQA